MNMFEKIVQWNRERGLIEKGFNHTKETSFIIEELLESTGNYDSISARERATEIASQITHDAKHEPEVIIDALFDIIIFATGAMAKLGYDPTKAMDEGFKEINSRNGTLIDGKFVKNLDAEMYEADFTSCKLNS
ncbi:MAG: hypothetical protein ACI870_000247 [Crocinitomicaceae bacterium]|jgi:hypothetical protein